MHFNCCLSAIATDGHYLYRSWRAADTSSALFPSSLSFLDQSKIIENWTIGRSIAWLWLPLRVRRPRKKRISSCQRLQHEPASKKDAKSNDRPEFVVPMKASDSNAPVGVSVSKFNRNHVVVSSDFLSSLVKIERSHTSLVFFSRRNNVFWSKVVALWTTMALDWPMCSSKKASSGQCFDRAYRTLLLLFPIVLDKSV